MTTNIRAGATAQSVSAASLYYLKHVDMWREIARRTIRRISTDAAREKARAAEAMRWCEENDTSLKRAIETVVGRPVQVRPFAELFSAQIREGNARTASCPVRLGGPGNLDLLFTLCEELNARVVVETGVAYGWSSLAILLSLRERPDARLVSVDLPYPLLRNDAWVGLVVPDELRAQWTLIRKSDRRGLPVALRQWSGVDLAHYDSDKSYSGRTWAYNRIWESLRPGGVLISDDVDENLAFRDFAGAVGVSPLLVRSSEGRLKYQGIMVKP